MSHRVPLVVQFGRFGEVHLVPPEVVQRSLHEETEVLVILDQPVPQRVLREKGGRGEKWKREREERRNRERQRREDKIKKRSHETCSPTSGRGTHLSKHLSIAHHHNSILGSCESHIESAGII